MRICQTNGKHANVWLLLERMKIFTLMASAIDFTMDCLKEGVCQLPSSFISAFGFTFAILFSLIIFFRNFSNVWHFSKSKRQYISENLTRLSLETGLIWLMFWFFSPKNSTFNLTRTRCLVPPIYCFYLQAEISKFGAVHVWVHLHDELEVWYQRILIILFTLWW